jgi:hypothetical protein
VVPIALALLPALSACGGGSDETPTVESTTTSTTTVPTTTAAPTTTTATAGQQITVTPATDLVSGQQVTVSGSGFSPNEPLVVTQCADKGEATGAGDCNLAGLATTASDAAGQVHLEFTVVKGPFGSNQIVCGPTQSCLVSITQATVSPTEEADAVITFR